MGRKRSFAAVLHPVPTPHLPAWSRGATLTSTRRLGPIVGKILREGHSSLVATAKQINEQGIVRPGGGTGAIYIGDARLVPRPFLPLDCQLCSRKQVGKVRLPEARPGVRPVPARFDALGN